MARLQFSWIQWSYSDKKPTVINNMLVKSIEMDKVHKTHHNLSITILVQTYTRKYNSFIMR